MANGVRNICEGDEDEDVSDGRYIIRKKHLTFLDVSTLFVIASILQCTMIPLSTKSCLKSSELRPILNGQFRHAISKNICLNVLRSKQPREILVFVILKL